MNRAAGHSATLSLDRCGDIAGRGAVGSVSPSSVDDDMYVLSCSAAAIALHRLCRASRRCAAIVGITAGPPTEDVVARVGATYVCPVGYMLIVESCGWKYIWGADVSDWIGSAMLLGWTAMCAGADDELPGGLRLRRRQ